MTTLTATTPLAQSIAARATGKSGSIKELMEGRADLYKLNPFLIQIEDGFNARDVESAKVQEHIDGLAQSIAKVGLKRALKVRMKNGAAVLVDGECRLRAVKRAIEVYGAAIHTVKVELADKMMSEAEATLSLVVENSGLDLNVMEKGQVFRRLETYGWSIADIAASAGLSSNRVGQLIEIAGLPAPVKEMIAADEIASTLAWTIAKDVGFDEAKTVSAIKGAIKTAKASGRTRATAKHVEGTSKGASFKTRLAALLMTAKIAEDDDGDGATTLVIGNDALAEIQKMLKISIPCD